MSNANAEYDKQDTDTNDDRPEGGDTVDNSYATSTGQKHIPVITDETPVEQPNLQGDPDSDETLERDEAEAIDKRNILSGDRTRGAKPTGGYTEPGDEEGLPGNGGRSNVRGY